MKKITFLMLHMGYGGVESAISNQANMLCNDYLIEIVSLYKLNYEIPHKLDEKIKLIYLSDIYPNKEEFLKTLKSKNIFKILKEGLNSLRILYFKKHLMKKYIKKCNSNIIVSTRLSFNKQLGNYAKNCIKISQEHVYHKNNKKYIKKVIKSLRKIDYFMPVSKELTKFYKQKIPKTAKCKYIPHALDFEVENYNFKPSLNLVAVARLSKEKGFLDLLEVIYILKNYFPNIKLNLIGDGNEKDNLINRINELHLDKNVKMHGFKKRNEINKILKKCSIYCMTSFEESFGLSVIEAMGFGIPCVAFDDAKGVLEIIDANTGIIIQNRDKLKMAKEIKKLLEDSKKLIKMSKNAYQKSLNYSFESVKKEWLEFYKGVLK